MNISELHKRINEWLVSQHQDYVIWIELDPVTGENTILKAYPASDTRGTRMIAHELDHEQAVLVLRTILTWIRS